VSPAIAPRHAANDGATEAARLRATAVQLEGLFVRQLFAAMRETVPTDGMMHGGAGEEMFTAMMHEHLADEVPAGWDRGLTAQLIATLQRAGSPPSPTDPASAADPTPLPEPR
jgi:Rod binding domain-containing protein